MEAANHNLKRTSGNTKRFQTDLLKVERSLKVTLTSICRLPLVERREFAVIEAAVRLHFSNESNQLYNSIP